MAKPSLRQRVKQLPRRGAQLLGLRPRPKKHGAPIRARALRALSRSSLVETNFVFRDRFWGGAVSSVTEDLERMQRLRREYVQNMVETDYILCTRGAGNFSYRLYDLTFAQTQRRSPVLQTGWPNVEFSAKMSVKPRFMPSEEPELR